MFYLHSFFAQVVSEVVNLLFSGSSNWTIYLVVTMLILQILYNSHFILAYSMKASKMFMWANHEEFKLILILPLTYLCSDFPMLSKRRFDCFSMKFQAIVVIVRYSIFLPRHQGYAFKFLPLHRPREQKKRRALGTKMSIFSPNACVLWASHNRLRDEAKEPLRRTQLLPWVHESYLLVNHRYLEKKERLNRLTEL